MNKFFFSIALGVAVTAAPAMAQGGGFMQRDQTRAEAQQRADMLFQMMDTNKDGSVTKAEADQALAQFQAARGDNGGRGGGRMQRMIDEAFATAPSVTQQQFEARALARFDAADLNHDGVVTAAEREQARARQPAPAPQTSPTAPQ